MSKMRLFVLRAYDSNGAYYIPLGEHVGAAEATEYATRLLGHHWERTSPHGLLWHHIDTWESRELCEVSR